MLRRITPIAICGFILIFAVKAILTDHNVVQAKAIKSSSTNSLVDYQYNKIDDISACENRELAVYFHDIYITYHSSEVINEALATAKSCDIKAINIDIFDIKYEDIPVQQVQDELEAYLDYHELENFATYDIQQIDMDTLSLNGRYAKISFSFNSSEDLKTVSYNGPVN